MSECLSAFGISGAIKASDRLVRVGRDCVNPEAGEKVDATRLNSLEALLWSIGRVAIMMIIGHFRGFSVD